MAVYCMSERPDATAEVSASERTAAGDALEATGAYETAEGIVLYDTEQPLAWLQSDGAVELAEMR